MDPDERAADAARRELAEEAGVVLPSEHPIHWAGTVPIRDGNGGHWLDLVYYSIVERTPTHFGEPGTSTQPEFPLEWLTPAEMRGRLSANAQAVVDCVSLALRASTA